MLVAASTALAQVGEAWPGFVWENWQKATGVEKPELQTPQAGQSALLPLLQTGVEGGDPIASPAAWEQKRDGIKATLAALLGEPGELVTSTSPPEVSSPVRVEGYTRSHVWIPGEEGDPIPAYLLLPDHPVSAPSPAMIVLHQTQAPGKDEACGITGDQEMAFADELAKRGYVCVVPDAIGFGERIPKGEQPYHDAMKLYERHPQWSFFGKMNWDVSRVVDYVSALKAVDPKRIGVIGHSHGAYGSIMAAIHEPRIALVVASCGFTTLRTDPNPDRWSHLTALMPCMGFYVSDVASAPLDWHEIAACIAPRPYFNWATLEDDIFPETANLAEVYTQLKSVYALYNNENSFHGELVPGKHRFPKEGREKAYAWIDTQFGVKRN
jgi:dienelactone hydrolase